MKPFLFIAPLLVILPFSIYALDEPGKDRAREVMKGRSVTIAQAESSLEQRKQNLLEDMPPEPLDVLGPLQPSNEGAVVSPGKLVAVPRVIVPQGRGLENPVPEVPGNPVKEIQVIQQQVNTIRSITAVTQPATPAQEE